MPSIFDNMAAYICARVLTDHNGCLLWSGQLDKNGYGQFRKRAKSPWIKAHRAAYEAFIGQIPAGLYVLHTCDIRNCCNPDHLWLGTHEENVADMVAKGRCSKGPSKKSHCKRGHELNSETRLGRRAQDCKICHRARQEKYREARHSLV